MDINIKLFGERNTATRAVKQMLRNTDGVQMFNTKRGHDLGNVEWANMVASINLYITDGWRRVYMDALRDNVAHHTAPLSMWKHAAPVWDDAFVDQNVTTIFCVRNPYSWALSMARKPYHMKATRTGDFLTFVKRPWLTERRDNVGIVLRSVMDLWTQKMRAYAEFADQAELSGGQYAYVRFEDFVDDPAATLARTLKPFGKNITAEPIQVSTKGGHQTLSDLQNYYRNEDWKDRLTASTVQAINDLMDWPLVDQFCYERLNASDFPLQLPAAVQVDFSSEMLNLNRKAEIEVAEKSA